MNQEEVKAAKERAAEVVNGFKAVREQNARDALKLAQECEAKDRQIDALKRRLLADSLRNAANKGQPQNPMADFFKSLGL